MNNNDTARSAWEGEIVVQAAVDEAPAVVVVPGFEGGG